MTQAIALAAVQDAIFTQYHYNTFELIAQVHYIRPDDVAHIDVYGCDDATTRRAIRADAVQLLQNLGIRVELIGGNDVYTVSPDYSNPEKLEDYASRLHPRLITTADYLRAYSEGRATRQIAMEGIGVKDYRGLHRALFDCGFGHATLQRDIELALLTDPTPAGWVYVNLEGVTPRIIAHTEDKDTFVAYVKRLHAILRALHGELCADPSASLRGMTFQINTAEFLDDQRAAARTALATRLADAGCPAEEITKLIEPSSGADTISEYATRMMGDDPAPAARIPEPRKRQPPSGVPIPESDVGDD